MIHDPQKDKLADLTRYDTRARSLLGQDEARKVEEAAWGSASVEPFFRPPYQFYEECVRAVVRPGLEVLELGAGTGRHTRVLLENGATVTATDLSPNALVVLEQKLATLAHGRLRTRVADLEALPFADSSFDVVACAGSLSYGDPHIVDSNVLRVLKPEGALICVDSLNHNPVYRLNRWLQYVSGARTRSTLDRMPTVARVESIAGHFASAEIRYFGAISWAMPLVARVAGPARATRFSETFDRALGVRRSAFKFVLVARGRT